MKSLNRNQLKYIVIVAMLIDHIAWGFVRMDSLLGQVMHFIGRLTGPTMAYFIVEGYFHTRDIKKYARRLAIFALISWPAFCFFEIGELPIQVVPRTSRMMGFRFAFDGAKQVLCIIPAFGVIYTLFLSLLAVWLLDKGKNIAGKILGILGLVVISIFGDWPIFDVLYAITFYKCHRKEKRQWILFSIITVSSFFLGGIGWTGLYQIGIFMVPLMIHFFYNGEPGSKKPIHKWFFYIFYPAHFAILGILRWLV